MKRDLREWKETYIYGKRPTNMERDPYIWNMERDPCIWKATYTYGKRLKNVARDIHA